MITCNTSNLNNIDKATPTNYQLVFPLIPTETSIGANNPFIMNIHTIMLPSVNLATEELRWQSNKTRNGMIPMEFDPWMVSFTIDSRLANWKLIFDWMNYINNNNDKIADYHKDYSVDCTLVVTDNYNNSVLEVVFVSIWPSLLGEVSFSQREGDIILESTVNFNYDYFYVKDTSWPIEFSSSSQSSSSRSWISSSSSSESSSSSSSLSESSSTFAMIAIQKSFDTTPLNVTLVDEPRWYDGNYTNNFRIIANTDAWGVALTFPAILNYIDTWARWTGGAGIPIGWSANDKIGLYKSNDNSTWEYVEELEGSKGDLPFIYNEYGNLLAFRATFSSPVSAQYFKLRNDGGTATIAVTLSGDGAGQGGFGVLEISEIEI